MKMVDLYGIVGLIAEGHGFNPFGGFFYITPEEDPRKLTSSLRGELTDCYGKSDIQGDFRHTELKFNKKYTSKNYAIKYNFKLNKNGMWLGEYDYRPQNLHGRAVCAITPFFKRLELFKKMPFDIERWAEELVERMVSEGRLVLIS